MKKKVERTDKKLSLKHDFLIILFGIIIAIVFIKTGFLKNLLFFTHGIWAFDSFVAGLFYTSGFTTPIALVALSEIAQVSSLFKVALFGAFGAVIGDYILFRFFRDKLDKDILILIKGKSFSKRLKAIFHLRLFRFVSLFIGGLFLATPLPDELGLAILGLSKTKTWVFITLSFIFKFSSILIIAMILRTI